MRLKDKVAIITGAAQGIGATFAAGFAKEGATIVIADILDGKGVAKSIEKAGGKAIFVRTDVTKQNECDALAKAASDRFGAIDILINNAAIFGDLVTGPFMEITDEEWRRVMDVNAGGPFRCTKAVFPYMKDRGGKIVNVCSAIIFEGMVGLPHYVASKGAVMAFTRSMARELGGFNINVNAIAPGFTHSAGGDKVAQKTTIDGSLEDIQMPMRSLKRSTYPEDLVGTAVFLASEESRNITGQLIVVDCGLVFH
ncbi:MAG TPA: SDR family oxidoreductase [Dehalococcoidia bacterium]|nr:SDR family oxidoreductase [Dehalococcoidia bacterium]